MRLQRLLTVALICISSALAYAQNANTMTELRVQLSWADTHDFREGAEVHGTANQDKSRSAPGQPAHGNAVTNLLIRVQLIDEDGATTAESSPDGEGRIRFVVPGAVIRNTAIVPLSYRLRVFGSEIEETIIDNIIPLRGDRIVNVVLRRKGEKASGGGGVVSATSLKIPAKAEKELDRGNKALMANKFEEAKAHFEKAIELYPAYDDAYNNLGVTLMKMGDNAGGRKAFEKALQVNDKSAKAYVNLARIAGQEKDYDRASLLLHQSLAIEPVNVEALGTMCQFDYLRGKLDDIPAVAIKLHGLQHEHFANCHFAAGDALEHEMKYDLAIVEYTVFIKEAPESSLVPKAKEAIQRLREQSGVPTAQ